MSKRMRMLMIGVLTLTPLAAGACQIPVGGGCSLWLAEPGVNFGLVCN